VSARTVPFPYAGPGYHARMGRDLPICATCGVQYGAPRADCPICLDERQYVGWDGQRWTTLAELTAAGHRGRMDEEGPGVIGVGTVPSVAIGQRALLVRAGAGNVLWDCVPYLDDDIVARVEELGGVRAIAVSHPHFYGTMIDWARCFDAPVYIHTADRDWIARTDDAVQIWDGDTLDLGDGLTLINAGVHFDGGQVLHWRGGEDGRGALFSIDTTAMTTSTTAVRLAPGPIPGREGPRQPEGQFRPRPREPGPHGAARGANREGGRCQDGRRSPSSAGRRRRGQPPRPVVPSTYGSRPETSVHSPD
jgi:hypothetical protein